MAGATIPKTIALTVEAKDSLVSLRDLLFPDSHATYSDAIRHAERIIRQNKEAEASTAETAELAR